jgi:hypothetical protein
MRIFNTLEKGVFVCFPEKHMKLFLVWLILIDGCKYFFIPFYPSSLFLLELDDDTFFFLGADNFSFYTSLAQVEYNRFRATHIAVDYFSPAQALFKLQI